MKDSFVSPQRNKRRKGVFLGGLFGLLALVTLNYSNTVQEIQSAPPEPSGTPLSLVTDTNTFYLPLIKSPAYSYLPLVVLPKPQPFSGDDEFEVGGQTHTLANPGRMRDTGMGWVKFQYKWAEGDDPAGVAGKIKLGHDRGFKVLLSVTGANIYPAANGINFSALVEYLRGVASLGANSPDAIEVWNEQNIDFEWPAGQISPSSYVNNMLAPAYRAIKSANPNIGVISGALAPTGFDNGYNAWADDRYIRGMASAGAADYMDCVGIHHNAGATSPTVSSGHPGGTHYSWYYKPMVDLYYDAFGGARRLCFTELGYLSGDGFPGLPPNFSWASGTSVSEHAQWLAEATSLSIQNGKVRLLIVYNVDFTFYNPAGDPQAGYAMIRPDGSCPACDTLSTVIPHSG